MGVGAVRTCNRVVTLPTSVGAVRSLRTCKRGGDFAHWRKCRSDMQAGGGRYEPGDGATTGRSPATAPGGFIHDACARRAGFRNITIITSLPVLVVSANARRLRWVMVNRSLLDKMVRIIIS